MGLSGLRDLVAALRFSHKGRPEGALPTVAIGGISAENLPEVIRAGADGVSVISAVVRGDVRGQAIALNQALSKLLNLK
jgi:thiamine-phosphate pyrophosphorylase